MTIRHFFPLAAALVFLLLPLTAAKSANAESQAGTAIILRFSAATPNCVIRLAPVQPGRTNSAASAVGCFSTFSGAISAATGGRVHLPSDMAPADLTVAMLTSGPYVTSTCLPDCSGTVLGVDYDNSNLSGDSLTYATNNSAECTGGNANYYFSILPSQWNDTISSGVAYGHCRNFRHYPGTDFQGTPIDCTQTCYSMGGTGQTHLKSVEDLDEEGSVPAGHLASPFDAGALDRLLP